ncbi:hypothetical protein [Glaciihabitans sp. UYNi722]|uniref:hypothetical protein n=1 Tax=Glaciihabitans sp. UYNi722 TaxID=3156344 RepID=UPI003396952A
MTRGFRTRGEASTSPQGTGPEDTSEHRRNSRQTRSESHSSGFRYNLRDGLEIDGQDTTSGAYEAHDGCRCNSAGAASRVQAGTSNRRRRRAEQGRYGREQADICSCQISGNAQQIGSAQQIGNAGKICRAAPACRSQTDSSIDPCGVGRGCRSRS